MAVAKVRMGARRLVVCPQQEAEVPGPSGRRAPWDGLIPRWTHDAAAAAPFEKQLTLGLVTFYVSQVLQVSAADCHPAGDSSANPTDPGAVARVQGGHQVSQHLKRRLSLSSTSEAGMFFPWFG